MLDKERKSEKQWNEKVVRIMASNEWMNEIKKGNFGSTNFRKTIYFERMRRSSWNRIGAPILSFIYPFIQFISRVSLIHQFPQPQSIEVHNAFGWLVSFVILVYGKPTKCFIDRFYAIAEVIIKFFVVFFLLMFDPFKTFAFESAWVCVQFTSSFFVVVEKICSNNDDNVDGPLMGIFRWWIFNISLRVCAYAKNHHCHGDLRRWEHWTFVAVQWAARKYKYTIFKSEEAHRNPFHSSS